jgi:hypothetical protein
MITLQSFHPDGVPLRRQDPSSTGDPRRPLRALRTVCANAEKTKAPLCNRERSDRPSQTVRTQVETCADRRVRLVIVSKREPTRPL